MLSFFIAIITFLYNFLQYFHIVFLLHVNIRFIVFIIGFVITL